MTEPLDTAAVPATDAAASTDAVAASGTDAAPAATPPPVGGAPVGGAPVGGAPVGGAAPVGSEPSLTTRVVKGAGWVFAGKLARGSVATPLEGASFGKPLGRISKVGPT
ncbi:MAG: hypothetical protein GXY85_09155 [Candidatus Brocadiaceae bacterium]|nr:hypothetical protein [Candidatus Brocadiaceae bacterium]